MDKHYRIYIPFGVQCQSEFQTLLFGLVSFCILIFQLCIFVAVIQCNYKSPWGSLLLSIFNYMIVFIIHVMLLRSQINFGQYYWCVKKNVKFLMFTASYWKVSNFMQEGIGYSWMITAIAVISLWWTFIVIIMKKLCFEMKHIYVNIHMTMWYPWWLNETRVCTWYQPCLYKTVQVLYTI